MNPYQILLYFAQAYGQGPYGGGLYSGSTSSSLVNTGVAIAAIITAACLIVFVALLVRFWRRPKRDDSSKNDV